MSLILNIETSTTALSVAVAKHGQLLSMKEQNEGYTHSENLTCFIEDVMNEANIHFSSLDAVAVSKGPGSYTGLRIGVSTAKGLCYALDKPLIAVNTLQHLAFSVSQKRNEKNILYCPTIDARRMEVYCAIFDSQNNYVINTDAKIIDESFFDSFLFNLEKGLQESTIYFFGDGAAKCQQVLANDTRAIFVDNVVPSAKDMISFSQQSYNNKAFEDLAYFEPYYLKDFVAGKKTIEK